MSSERPKNGALEKEKPAGVYAASFNARAFVRQRPSHTLGVVVAMRLLTLPPL
ncbi:conserved hypothetical protein [Ricinus communis]|uniref:Uncharacterized protein n=1 Tax=Ricinus communis TaxID=3988 RepID=B9TCL5_RICCO|nr:conserved hypothetical protein [Ricinus communis]